jgi:hypothetical protein
MSECFSALFASAAKRHDSGNEAKRDGALGHAWKRPVEFERLTLSSSVSDLAQQAATLAAFSAEDIAIPTNTLREHPPF